MATPPPNYTPGQGGLATSVYDFENHVNGTAFRHTATEVDLSTPVEVGNETFATVETAIDALASALTGSSSAQVGFLNIPDGYDTYHNANDTTNFDSTIPSLDTFLNPLFSAITTGTGLPAAYAGLVDGGMLIIPSGTYIIKNTVLVPPGITLMGVGFGTKVVNATALYGSGSAPMFQILADTVSTKPARASRANTDAAIDSNVFMFSRETRIWNMVISDNFVEPKFLGDTAYATAQNTSSSIPLIQQNNGSNLSLNNVFIQGRVNTPTITSSAVTLNTTYPATTGTILTVNQCFIDGFSVPIQWLSNPGSSATANTDFLTVTNSKIRAYGYLSSNSSSNIDNSVITMNDNNANISNNYIYGNGNNIAALVYMSSHISNTPNYGARSKVSITNNNIEINRSSNATNSTFTTFISNFGATSTYSSVLEFGNNFQDKFSVSVDGYTSALNITQSALTVNTNEIVYGNLTVSGNTTIDGNAVIDGTTSLGGVPNLITPYYRSVYQPLVPQYTTFTDLAPPGTSGASRISFSIQPNASAAVTVPITKVLNGATLVSVTLHYYRYGSAVPGNYGYMYLIKMTTSNTQSNIGSLSSMLSPSFGANSIQILSLSEVIDDSTAGYGLVISGEYGANAVGLNIFAVVCSFLVSSIGQ